FGQAWIGGNRLLVPLDRLGQFALGQRLSTTQIQFVSPGIDQPRGGPCARAARLQLYTQRRRDLLRDLRLHLEDVLDVTRVLARPDGRSVQWIDQLERDLDVVG